MKLKWILAVAAVGLGMSAPAREYKYTTVPGDMMQTRIYTLDNGLKVFLSVNPEKPRIQTYIAVRTGSKNDPAETTGLAHYLEHLMFKGTRQFGTTDPGAEEPLLDEIEQRYEAYRRLTDPEARRKAYHGIDSVSQAAAQYFIPNEYDKLMAAIGAEGTNAYTSNDVTCYTENIPSNEIDNWARIQADRFRNMVIRGFHTELEAVYEEYNIGLTSDSRKLFAAMCKMLWPNHPYGTQTTIGTQEHLKNPSITNIKNYFNKWYRPNNVAVCMAGDMDPDRTVAIIDKYFGSWKPGADVRQPTFAPLPPLTQPEDTAVVGQEAEEVWVAWRAGQANSLQADTLNLLSSVLSNGRAGLFDLNLNQTMKVLSCGAGAELLRDHSAFLLWGNPRQGQSLEDVRSLMLGEIEKLKKGDFPENLLPSIINNCKRNRYQLMESNEGRADMFVEAFINEVDWKQEVESIDRISKITKQELVAFAGRFFTDACVTVFKRQGVDSLQKKIDKPAITPIPANRDTMSRFVKEIQNAQVEPIRPRFVDFGKDMTMATTGKGLPMRYVRNTVNGLFQLNLRYEFGRKADNRYDVATEYIEYLGTDKYTAAELKQKFYELGCDFYVGEGGDAISVCLTGLSENMQAALALGEELLQNAKVDRKAYSEMVDRILKRRDDDKKNQRGCFNRLYSYGVFGERNFSRDIMTEEQLKSTDPQVFVDLLRNLSGYEHSVEYYGPMSVKEVSDIVTGTHRMPGKLMPVPQNREYERRQTPVNEVWIAPYDAKNIYMCMYHDEHRDWNVDEAAVVSLFNEYFGGNMSGIVFQEMREARGLAYSASAYYARPDRKGGKESYMTYIITQNDKMMDCISHFRTILNEMPVSETAFRIAKDALTKQLASMRTTKMGIIGMWNAMKQLGLDCDLNRKIYQDLEKVTLQDIVNFEKKTMADKTYRYIILGDEKELDMKELEKIGPVRKLTIEEVFGY
jgi:predicted Zn-dependent peptidase